MNESKARELIERHFVEALPPAKFAKLWEHVQGCQGCKAHYDKLAAFEARLDGGQAEAERLGESLFAAMEPKKQGLFSGGFAFTWPFPRIIGVGAAAALLLVIVGPQLARQRSPAAEEFTERSGGAGFGPELLATCFKDEGGRLEGLAALDGAKSVPACPRGGRLVFAYRNAREGDVLAVFAVRGPDAALIVPPTPLDPGTEKRMLKKGFAIEADAAEGEVKLVAVFATSLDGAKMEAALAAGKDPAAAAEALSGPGAVIRTLSYRLEKR